jgi:tripartite-type tricarboxylate transporter receptor subunit TctC
VIHFVRTIVLGIFLAIAGASASLEAQTYPSRPIRLVVGFPAGGPTDIVARVMAQCLSERLGQQIVVENRPGAGSNVATQAVIASSPDGYTLMILSPPHAINTTLYKKLPYDFLKEIAPVAGIAQGPNVMEVHPSLPVKTVAEFIAYAKENPGKLSFASAGNGTTIHLSGELFMAMTGIKMQHVPYRGSAPALIDMISGQVHVMFDNVLSSIGHLQSGALRPLAVTSRERLATLPDVPTVAETVPGYETTTWWGLGAPKSTPRDTVEKLNRENNACLREDRIKQRFAELGSTPMIMTPEEFAAFLAAETEKWAKVVKFSGASVD